MKNIMIAVASFFVMVSFIPSVVHAEGEKAGAKTAPVESA